MRKKLLFVVVLLALLTSSVMVASAGGQTAGQLENAGWDCPVLAPHDWKHCFPPSITFPEDLVNESVATVQVKVFSEFGESFFGTELLIHDDLYAGQSCSQDSLPQYGDVPGVPYRACHHFDTSTAES